LNYFPVFFDLRGRSALVVGGDEPAARRIRLLLKAGADVTVVAPRVNDEIADLIATGKIRAIRRGFVAGDVRDRVAVFAASGKAGLDERVAEAARTAGIPVNVTDRPEVSSFIVPAIVDRDPVVIGISTAGTAPVLARRLRERIERLLPSRLGALARFAESFRSAVRATVPDARARLRFWERFFDGSVAATLLAGDESAARERMLTLVNSRAANAQPEGSVAIVGAGPGDADLLTLKALRLLQQADVVIYDRLVAPEILDLARRDALRLYVGKARGQHSKSQDEINALIAEHAEAGRRVVRLKGGDPFVFGRGGEELDYLRRRDIPVEAVPGITAALGCAAASGIPLTHRELAQAITFITGQAKDGEPDLDWQALARLGQTLVIYMGVATAGRISERLIEHGLDAATPVAVIENGTRATQRTVLGRLGALGELVAESGIAGPAIIIIGAVARLADASDSSRGDEARADAPVRIAAVG
jgi:uroporphyrin-III C-methyltransferase/precorrin-2 dehydrogenase/sirohydrochlorin ferrochelatase